MESSNTVDEGFRSISIIAYAFMAGLAIFILVTSYLITSGQSVGQGAFISPTVDIAAIGGFALVCLTVSRLLSNKQLEMADREALRDPNEAMNVYRSAKILRLALLESPGLMATIFALITGNKLLLLVAMFMLAMLYLARPTRDEFAEWRG